MTAVATTAVVRPFTSEESQLATFNAQVASLITEVLPPLTEKSDSRIKRDDPVRVCMDYLFSTVFPSIRDFVHYVREYSRMALPAGQTFEIQNIGLIGDNGTEEPIPYRTVYSVLLDFPSRLTSVLGKNFSYSFVDPLLSEPDIKGQKTADRYWICISRDTIWRDDPKEAINSRLSDMFRLMIACSIYEVNFDRRVNFWGCPTSLYEEKSPIDERINRLFQSRLETHPMILRTNHSIDGKYGFVRLDSNGHVAFYSENKFKLSLTTRSSLSSIDEFVEWITLFGSIYVPPGREFEVRDLELESLTKAADKVWVRQDFTSEFIFSQMVVHLGKNIRVISLGRGKGTFQCTRNFDKISIGSSADELEIGLRVGAVTTTVDLLAAACFRHGSSSVRLAPSQTLTLYEVPAEAVKPEGKWPDWKNIFPNSNVPGTRWASQGRSDVGRGTSIPTSDPSARIPYFTFCPEPDEKNFRLALSLSPPEELIAGLVRVSSKKLAADLAEYEVEAITFLCFRAMVVYCFDGFRMYKNAIPNFFDGTTPEKTTAIHRAIGSLWTDAEFIKARRAILQNRELRDLVTKLCTTIEPENFDKIDYRWFPKSVEIVFHKLKRCATEIMQGSLFVTTHLQKYFETKDDGIDRKTPES